jgi:hypothetical protein
MIRKGLALTAAVLMSVCLGGCGGSNGGDAELRPPVNDEPGVPPGVIGAERSEEAGEPPAEN